MSAHSFPIHFDDRPLVDNVVLSVIPIDGFSGRIVTRGVKASIDGLLNQPIRNLSGHLVFVNLPIQRLYTVSVDATEAGYFSPAPSVFDPNAPNSDKRHVVQLMRPAAFAFDDATTLIRGVVLRGTESVVGARVWCEFTPPPQLFLTPSQQPPPFETRTGDRGAFALAVRIAASTPPERGSGKFRAKLHLKEGRDTLELKIKIKDGRPNIFSKPIDIAGANVAPDFVN